MDPERRASPNLIRVQYWYDKIYTLFTKKKILKNLLRCDYFDEINFSTGGVFTTILRFNIIKTPIQIIIYLYNRYLYK